MAALRGRYLNPGAYLDPEAFDAETNAKIDRLADSYEMTGDEFRTGLRNLQGASMAAGGSNRLNTPDPTIPQDLGAAAFFDVDNTLIKGASLLVFARGLARKKFFTVGEILQFLWMQAKFRVMGKENAGDIASGRQQALQLVAGHKEQDLIQLGEEIWAQNMAERIFPGTKELADKHLRAGHEVWLVTASPVQLAQIIARELGFTGALGTVTEVKDGKFTGNMVGDILHGPGKKHAVLALAASEGLDLERCTAYSDSSNDLPMLSMVGTAVAVNPDSELRRIAKARDWEIRDYRRTRRILKRYGAPAAGAAAVAGGYWIKRR
ncbi:HAD-IB family hydrolase [Corynebacterium sp. 320]|uniref:HAD-IB family hydrolase n=2 Tax=Corynebacteriaceae TaxID=1653 RepID=A0ABQ6VGQ3_9CORY|nr:HAD-IB family hydrolase [Corynebacterium sp. 320]KAB1553345.1 HAD-IB family hydrolase [Corynebacterium sp. 321]KAB1554544.1 HAD-IB family hydrolase [Corynebacterium sp. 319]KAB3523590.1 HAD-IB family hydrolase [Corynebacterium zhongnanshanii]KAB3528730.1 HAD-IB family hydrolase [Corynebacterium sp. 250]KAB3540834.1 HAD-IB family hydrolase [Corynebacterium sp. 366]MCR5914222.1 HAD-IB family hydrolase [Corynebacterium sp. zg254]